MRFLLGLRQIPSILCVFVELRFEMEQIQTVGPSRISAPHGLMEAMTFPNVHIVKPDVNQLHTHVTIDSEDYGLYEPVISSVDGRVDVRYKK